MTLLYQFGVGLGFLATIRLDSGPRLHPICPILHQDRLLAFIVPSPKLDDLRRDGRYALHCFPPADNEDAFYVTGQAEVLDDGALRAAVAEQFVGERTVVACSTAGRRPRAGRARHRHRSPHPHVGPRRPRPAAHHLEGAASVNSLAARSWHGPR